MIATHCMESRSDLLHSDRGFDAFAILSRSGLVRIISRDQAHKTFVSTARMTLPDVIAQPFLQLLEAFWLRPIFGKQSPMDILRTQQSGTANDNPIAVGVPYQRGSGTDAQPLSSLRRNGNLPL